MKSKKILFPAIHRPERSPSQRYRFEQYFNYLKYKDVSVTYSYLISKKDDQYYHQPGHVFRKVIIFIKAVFIRFYDVLRAPFYDTVFIQREAFMLGTLVFERLFKLMAKHIVFDFDDAIWMQQPRVRNNLHFLKSPSKTKKIIQLTDVVLAGNQFLADYASQFNENTFMLPTVVDTDYYKPIVKGRSNKIVIGWSGSPTTINHFKYIEEPLSEILRRYGNKIEIIVYGDESYKNEKLGVKGIRWSKETEKEVIGGYDIGIMPLEDNEWERGKCGMKALLYMSMGIATIASPVGVNTAIIGENEFGILANKAQDWVEKFSLLIENECIRKKISEKGRMRAIEKYSVLSVKELFYQKAIKKPSCF
ncbi:MAG: glycosyltransferase [Cyclobacteriaceae bacterium]